MRYKIFFVFSIIFSHNGELKAENSTSCGDWVQFRDEKCFKILDDTFRTYAEAEKSCALLENEPTLPILHTKEEQDFLSEYLFKTQKKMDNFWIGAQFVDNKFHWADNSDLSYTNWEKDGPRSKANYCVQIEADEARLGKWIDEPCTKKNLVVCQKAQIWSSARLQKVFLETRKKLTDELEGSKKKSEELKQKLEEANKKIDNLEKNEVPVCFVYAQLPNEKAPTEIWPGMTWLDVSPNYSGVFFRVNGGDAEPFGQVQQDNAPRLDTIISGTKSFIVTSHTGMDKNVSIPRTGWSEAFYTGTWDSDHFMFINFRHSSSEIRPRNMAIRIWKRTL